MQKMWRAALEFAGLGKQDVLFEEAFAFRLARELKRVIESHPMITAHCSPFVRPDRVIEHAAIELLDAPSRVRPSSTIVMKVRVSNVGSTTWNERPRLREDATAKQAEEVRLGIQLLNADGGIYTLKFDLVREGVRWFEAGGSEPRVHHVEVITH